MTLPTGSWREEAGDALAALRDWPWYETLRTLAQRFREDRLGVTAGSLTFSTLIALVPLATVMLAVFSAFPIFASLQQALQAWFLHSLVPTTIARPVLETITAFAGKARGIGSIGLVVFGATALATMLTIDRSLNAIWRVRRARSIARRVLLYWGALTLGPLLVGFSLSLSSYAASASRGLVVALPGVVALALQLAELALVALAFAALFHHVPNTWVRWRDAAAGGLFVAVALQGAKAALAWYLAAMPGISVIYGTFATLPILMLWLYLVWVIVLLGAVIAAYAPSLQMRVARRHSTPAYRFELALTLLQALRAAREGGRRGLTMIELAGALRADPLQIEPLLEQLMVLDWIGRLDEDEGGRFVLLADPARTPAVALIDALLLPRASATDGLRRHARFDTMLLADLLG